MNLDKTLTRAPGDARRGRTDLDDGQQCIEAVQVGAAGLHGHPDHGQRRQGGHHAWQVRGAPRPRDYDLPAYAHRLTRPCLPSLDSKISSRQREVNELSSKCHRRPGMLHKLVMRILAGKTHRGHGTPRAHADRDLPWGP
jgi:hypothetical protein